MLRLGGKLVFESCSATWNLSNDDAFAIETRKTTGSEVYLRIQSVPHAVLVIKTSQLVLYRKIITVCSVSAV